MAKPILIIDANREFGILIRQSLEEDGHYRATLVHSGQQAIEAATDQQFELALIDFGLPDLPGAEVVRQLNELNPGISIVAIPIDGRAEELEALDVAGILTKPFYLPDLPRIIDKSLSSQSLKSNWIQWDQADKPSRQPATPEPPKPSVKTADVSPAPNPPTTASGERKAGSGLANQLELGVERIGAQAALIWDGQGSVVNVGLTRDQMQELAEPLAGLSEQIEQKRAVTCYVKLPDREDDSLLYASPWADGQSLIVLYPAAAAFRQVRRGMQQLADQLEQETAPAASIQPERAVQPTAPIGATAESDEIPEDWVPETEFSPAQRAVLEELASIEPPPPDPAPATTPLKPDHQASGSPDLPDDWIPTNRRPQEVLALIDEPEPSAHKPTRISPGQAEADQLEYNLVLLPRFPEHRFTSELADQLHEWVHRICLAWDWRAQQIEVGQRYLRLRVRLKADSAPAQAVQQLKADLARHILSAHPNWNAALPSGNFFAQQHLLTAGQPPDQEGISSFIQQVRSTQGLSG